MTSRYRRYAIGGRSSIPVVCFFLIFFNSFNSLSYLFNFKVAGMVPYELLWHLEDEHKDDVECQYWLEEYYGTPSSWYVIFNFGNLQNGSLG
jgi:hypothetical protein